MNTYLAKSKVDFIKAARDDLLKLYNINYTPFTRKIYFYFFELGGKKYIHKEALKFVYTNADTFTTDIDPDSCALEKQISVVDILPFLSSYTGTLLPKLLEDNDKFFVYEYFDGSPIEDISAEEFYYLKSQHELLPVTPFYNSMTYNLARNNETIKLIDFKHFDYKRDLPFFMYLYNEDNRVNTLYIEKNTNTGPIADHLGIDYPVEDAKIIEY
jgi:hypothetical protein